MIRRLLSWHEDPALVDRVRTPAGRLLLLLCVAPFLPPGERWAVLAALAFLFAFPQRRVEILALGGVWVLYRWLPPSESGGAPWALAGMAAVLGFLYLGFAAARRFREAPGFFRKWPIAWTHLAFLCLLLAAAAPAALGAAVPDPVRAATDAFRALILFLLWRVSYMILSGKRGSAAGTRFRDHVCYCLPVWGGTFTPYGKGHDYLAGQRKDDGRDLAQTRLSGLKLLMLAWVWTKALYFFNAVTVGSRAPYIGTLPDGWSLGLPGLTTAIGTGPAPYGAGGCWIVLLAEFVRATLRMAIQGHVIIGILRLAGFRVFRNTYKPLLSRTIVEFWNRYYYYFKELLVEFFFYPVFMAAGKRTRQVRIVLAVLAAATFGNLYFHLVRDHAEYFLHGPWTMVDRVAGRAVYCAALGIGIVVSMLREQRRRGASAPEGNRRAADLRAIAGVWLFFSLLQVWSVGLERLTFAQRFRFFLGLLGL